MNATRTTASIASQQVRVGNRTVTLMDVTHGFSAGDDVVVNLVRAPHEVYAFEKIPMNDISMRSSTNYYRSTFYRKVISVHGRTLLLDAPLPEPFDPCQSYGSVSRLLPFSPSGVIEMVGVSSFRVVSKVTNTHGAANNY